jgi:hypothetical protein
MKIQPSNLAAQLSYRGRGNPANAHPVSAISNCFPGLEFDFRTIYRRMFVGIELSEHTNYIVKAEEPHCDLIGHRLLFIGDTDTPVAVKTTGIGMPGYPGTLKTQLNPEAVSFMEWSNNLARVWEKSGQSVTGWFTADRSLTERLPPTKAEDIAKLVARELTLRPLFEPSALDGGKTATLARVLADPGDLSEGLCSPWQNDYRECACYYWAASRPDYVNVTDTPSGVTTGEQWMTKAPTPAGYIPDDRADPRLWSYDDLFKNWQEHLRFIIGGTDAQDRRERGEPG